ncbi:MULTISPECIES: hypothetical protein [Streptomyces]|uniref:hypothetical protein n=1 Tax=Streptomyces TaxID=1883 RepID=UPI000241AF0C|nr:MULTISPECIES: hypothetical protein [Streptomyces]EHM27141.1 putative helicase-like protein [Streptomyces sp. W007]WTD07746.1 hypothetical protein OHA54_00215 [Streptomyces anulatus]WTD23089.1 hypothetical protein OH737_00370 [Streptomyces anulatus]WTE01033.1 hypothetical protein OH765_00215 [Streptomyces anulatus]
MPRGAVVEVAVDGETEPVPVKLGVWISNTKSRKDRLDTDQLTALATPGMDRAGPVADTEAAPAPAVQDPPLAAPTKPPVREHC